VGSPRISRGQHHVLANLTLRKEPPETNEQEGGWAPEKIWLFRRDKSPTPAKILILDCLAIV